MKMKIKRGNMYYLVIHKRDWTYKPAVIVPVKLIKRKGIGCGDWVIVEQQVDGIKHKTTVHTDWLAPYKIQQAKNLLHNMRQWEERWGANCWRHRLNHKTAKDEVLKRLSTLSKCKQQELWKQFTAAYPELVKPGNVFKVSKMKMEHWDEIAWAIITLKYPLKEVWPVLSSAEGRA